MKDKISIIIPVYGKNMFTILCLKAIDRYTPYSIDYQVIVVDDCSNDPVEYILFKSIPNTIKKRLKVSRNDKNLGYGRSIGNGVKEADGNILILLNNDVFVTEGWIDALLSSLKNKGGDIIGAKLLYPDRTIQHSGGVFCYDFKQETVFSYHIYRGFHSNFIGVNKRRRFQWVTFACVMMRRQIFETLGGFDDTFLNSYEDVDFCLRASKNGYTVLYEPTSVSYHVECGTKGYDNPQDMVNHQRFTERYKMIPDDDFRYYIEDGIPIGLGREFSARQFVVEIKKFQPNILMDVLEKDHLK